MFESLILGAIQGIAEWLPISSQGFLVLAKVHLFQSGLQLSSLVEYALFLHLGTFLAALIYFRKKVYHLIKALFKYKKTNKTKQKTLVFLIISSIISAIFGLSILKGIEQLEKNISLAGQGVTLLVGILLLITGLLQLFKKTKLQYRASGDLKISDGIFMGFIQSLSILPGFSRSGLTISALLLTRFKEKEALTLSFLMSLPAVLGANILLNSDKFLPLSLPHLIGLATSFIFGIITIHLFFKVAEKLNFGWFVLLFGTLTILAVLV